MNEFSLLFKKKDTYLYSDESSNSPVKSKFQLSSSDASNGTYNNGKNFNSIQQKQLQKQNNNFQEDKSSQNMKDTTKANFIKRDKQKYQEEDQDEEEKKDQKSDFQKQQNSQNDQVSHTKTIRERFSLPEKSKETQPQSIKEINRALSSNDQQATITSSNSNNGQLENDQQKIEVRLLQFIIQK